MSVASPDQAPESLRELARKAATSELQTRLQREIWSRRSARLGLRIDVPPCPYDDAMVADLMDRGRALAYLPVELSSHRTRDRFSTLFPTMGSYAEPPANGFANVRDTWGWFDYETTTDAPRVDLTEDEVRRELTTAGLTMLTLDQYIVASQDQFLLAGKYLDQRRSWVRLATRYDGRLIAARFDGEAPEEGREDEPPMPGALLVGYDVAETDNGTMLGVRTSSGGASRRAVWQELRYGMVRRFLAAGFPAALGMSESAYMAGLPRVPEQPTEYRERLDVPILVEPRIPWRDQADLLGVRVSNHSRRFTFEVVEPDQIPTRPYLGWFNAWNERFDAPVSSVEARSKLAADECGATAAELLAVHTALPDLARTTRYFEAIGEVKTSPTTTDITNRSAGRCLCLYVWRGGPEVGSNQHPIAYSMFRPLLRGRRVTVGPPKTEETP